MTLTKTKGHKMTTFNLSHNDQGYASISEFTVVDHPKFGLLFGGYELEDFASEFEGHAVVAGDTIRYFIPAGSCILSDKMTVEIAE